MNCNCKWTETVLAVVILVFAIWPSAIVSASTSRWIVIVAAALLLIHAWACKNCGACAPKDKMGMSSKPAIAAKPVAKKGKK